MNLDNIRDKLQYTNRPAFHQLYKFHHACSTTAAEAISSVHLTWITSSHYPWWGLTNISCPQLHRGCYRYQYTMGPSQSTWAAPTPYHNYIMHMHSALQEHPCMEAVTQPYFLMFSYNPKPTYEDNACQSCQLTMLGLPEFSHILGEEVERCVSEVRHFLALQVNTYFAHPLRLLP